MDFKYENNFQVGDFGLFRIKCNILVFGGVRGIFLWMVLEFLNGSSIWVLEKVREKFYILLENKIYVILCEQVDVFLYGICLWEILIGEEFYVDMYCGVIIGKFNLVLFFILFFVYLFFFLKGGIVKNMF